MAKKNKRKKRHTQLLAASALVASSIAPFTVGAEEVANNETLNNNATSNGDTYEGEQDVVENPTSNDLDTLEGNEEGQSEESNEESAFNFVETYSVSVQFNVASANHVFAEKGTALLGITAEGKKYIQLTVLNNQFSDFELMIEGTNVPVVKVDDRTRTYTFEIASFENLSGFYNQTLKIEGMEPFFAKYDFVLSFPNIATEYPASIDNSLEDEPVVEPTPAPEEDTTPAPEEDTTPDTGEGTVPDSGEGTETNGISITHQFKATEITPGIFGSMNDGGKFITNYLKPYFTNATLVTIDGKKYIEMTLIEKAYGVVSMEGVEIVSVVGEKMEQVRVIRMPAAKESTHRIDAGDYGIYDLTFTFDVTDEQIADEPVVEPTPAPEPTPETEPTPITHIEQDVDFAFTTTGNFEEPGAADGYLKAFVTDSDIEFVDGKPYSLIEFGGHSYGYASIKEGSAEGPAATIVKESGSAETKDWVRTVRVALDENYQADIHLESTHGNYTYSFDFAKEETTFELSTKNNKYFASWVPRADVVKTKDGQSFAYITLAGHSYGVSTIQQNGVDVPVVSSTGTVDGVNLVRVVKVALDENNQASLQLDMGGDKGIYEFGFDFTENTVTFEDTLTETYQGVDLTVTAGSPAQFIIPGVFAKVQAKKVDNGISFNMTTTKAETARGYYKTVIIKQNGEVLKQISAEENETAEFTVKNTENLTVEVVYVTPKTETAEAKETTYSGSISAMKVKVVETPEPEEKPSFTEITKPEDIVLEDNQEAKVEIELDEEVNEEVKAIVAPILQEATINKIEKDGKPAIQLNISRDNIDKEKFKIIRFLRNGVVVKEFDLDDAQPVVRLVMRTLAATSSTLSVELEALDGLSIELVGKDEKDTIAATVAKVSVETSAVQPTNPGDNNGGTGPDENDGDTTAGGNTGGETTPTTPTTPGGSLGSGTTPTTPGGSTDFNNAGQVTVEKSVSHSFTAKEVQAGIYGSVSGSFIENYLAPYFTNAQLVTVNGTKYIQMTLVGKGYGVKSFSGGEFISSTGTGLNQVRVLRIPAAKQSTHRVDAGDYGIYNLTFTFDVTDGDIASSSGSTAGGITDEQAKPEDTTPEVVAVESTGDADVKLALTKGNEALKDIISKFATEFKDGKFNVKVSFGDMKSVKEFIVKQNGKEIVRWKNPNEVARIASLFGATLATTATELSFAVESLEGITVEAVTKEGAVTGAIQATSKVEKEKPVLTDGEISYTMQADSTDSMSEFITNYLSPYFTKAKQVVIDGKTYIEMILVGKAYGFASIQYEDANGKLQDVTVVSKTGEKLDQVRVVRLPLVQDKDGITKVRVDSGDLGYGAYTLHFKFDVEANGSQQGEATKPAINNPFKDIENSSYKDDILALYQAGITTGTSDTSFSPSKSITRAQFAVMIARALGLQSTNATQFTDVKGKWYVKEVQALVEAGIVTNAKTFNPGKNITRQQAAAMIHRMLEYKGFTSTATAADLSFKDSNKVQSYAKGAIAELQKQNIMTGSNGYINANGNLTRGQMAKILKRSLELIDFKF